MPKHLTLVVGTLALGALVRVLPPAPAAAEPASPPSASPTVSPIAPPSVSDPPRRDQPELGEIATLPLEKLMDIEVVTLSKHGERLAETAAATFVLTNDDIRRSGATSIPEALRLVPGLDVAQVDASNWAISSRGFNGLFANKLLVMIDGRSVYSPFYSGVFWLDQDLMLEDVDRIEVVRGPGGTLWGPNAVNGVINIITKKAADTQGTLVSAGGGTEDLLLTAVRHGGEIPDFGHWRAYAKFQEHDNSRFAAGGSSHDAWERFRSGLRIDGRLASDTTATLSGDWLFNRQQIEVIEPQHSAEHFDDSAETARTTAGDVLARIDTTLSPDSHVQAQLSYERVNKSYIVALHEDILDFDIQHHYRFAPRNQLVYGAGFRFYTTDIGSESFLRFDPAYRRRNTWSWFLSDETAVVPDSLFLTLGSKFEHNQLSFFEFQPSIRIRYSPSSAHTVWGSITRAVHTPSAANEDVTLDITAFRDAATGAVVVPEFLGNDEVHSESVIAYEAGYRTTAVPHSAIDVALFYNSYNNLGSEEMGQPEPTVGTDGSPVLILPLISRNDGDTSFWGGEIVDTVTLTDTWRLSGWYGFLRIDRDGETTDINGSPQNQFGLRTSHDLAPGIEADAFVRYAERLRDLHVPAVVDATVRVSWMLDQHLRLSIVGQHLIEAHHPEFISEFLQLKPSEIERGIFANATYTY